MAPAGLMVPGVGRLEGGQSFVSADQLMYNPGTQTQEASMEKVKIGIVGCGNISAAYLRTAQTFEILDAVACADIDPTRAAARAAEFGIPRVYQTVDELMADPEIQIVVNLTNPQAHTAVNLMAIAAGKHVYTEKPFAVTREEGARTLAAAAKAGLRVGCAPGTFLGGGLQTCRKLIDEGVIGQPVACTAFMMSPGHESWHPDPAYYYKLGAGPMFDMGPYYNTAMATMLGRIKRVTGAAGIQIPERTITSQPSMAKNHRRDAGSRGGPIGIRERRHRHHHYHLCHLARPVAPHRDLWYRGYPQRA
jgi:predicted dehydrogenase